MLNSQSSGGSNNFKPLLRFALLLIQCCIRLFFWSELCLCTVLSLIFANLFGFCFFVFGLGFFLALLLCACFLFVIFFSIQKPVSPSGSAQAISELPWSNFL